MSARRTKPIAFGIVHGFSGAPAQRRGRRRPGAVEAATAAGRSGELAARGLTGTVSRSSAGHRLRGALERDACGRRARAAPAPRPYPTPSERRPTVSRSGTPSSSASANFSPGPASRSSKSDVEAGGAQLLVEPLGGLALVGCRPCRARRARRPTARARAATRSPARRRTARPRRRRSAPGRSRRSPSTTSCSLPLSSR